MRTDTIGPGMASGGPIARARRRHYAGWQNTRTGSRSGCGGRQLSRFPTGQSLEVAKCRPAKNPNPAYERRGKARFSAIPQAAVITAAALAPLRALSCLAAVLG